MENERENYRNPIITDLRQDFHVREHLTYFRQYLWEVLE